MHPDPKKLHARQMREVERLLHDHSVSYARWLKANRPTYLDRLKRWNAEREHDND